MVFPTEAHLKSELERRLGCKVKRLFVRETDYVKDTTVVDVRYIPVVKVPRVKEPRLSRAERDRHEVIA
jgi:hypothetical protein